MTAPGSPPNAEEGRIVRANMTERMVESGFDRRLARRLAEDSYRRVATRMEAEDAMRHPGKIHTK